MAGWSEILAQTEHGLISLDLPSLPAVNAVPQVWTLSIGGFNCASAVFERY